jgi:hypothetical protein
MTPHNQTKELTTWFFNLPLDESIDNKSTYFEVWIQDPMKHSRRPKAKKSLRRSSGRRENSKASKWQEKRQARKKQRKAQNQKTSPETTSPNTLNVSSPP